MTNCALEWAKNHKLWVILAIIIILVALWYIFVYRKSNNVKTLTPGEILENLSGKTIRVTKNRVE